MLIQLHMEKKKAAMEILFYFIILRDFLKTILKNETLLNLRRIRGEDI